MVKTSLFVRRTSIDVPFVDLTQVMSLFNKNVGQVGIIILFFFFEVSMFKSPIMRMLSYFLIARLNVFESSLKKISLLLLYGGQKT